MPAATPAPVGDWTLDPQGSQVRVVAHRGDAEAARENTLAAFSAALEIGVDVLELDVRTSADQVAMVIHDSTALRLWGCPAPIDELTAAQLQQLGTDPVRIPTLVQVLDLVAGAARRPVVLVDTTTARDAQTALAVVQAHPAVIDGRVRIEWCGSHESTRLVRAADPQAVLALAHYGGPLDLALIDELAPAVINLEASLLTADLVEQIHGLGLKVATWTLDDAESFTWVLAIGVDSVTTNRPRLLQHLFSLGSSPLALAWMGEQVLLSTGGFTPEVARAVVVARQIAERVIEYTRTASLGQVTTKAHAADVVTVVDVGVEQMVREMIAAALPDHLVVGEELGGTTQSGVPTWYVDPVDGTTNLANHIPWTSLSLALAIDNHPLVAVVAQPWTGDIYLAVTGIGAIRNGLPLVLDRVDTLQGKALFTELSAHVYWPGQLEFMQGLADQHCTARIAGSGTLTLAQVSAGIGVAGVVHRFNPIDHLAGTVIAAEAGARVLNSDGGDSTFPASGGMMVAAPGAAELLWPIWRDALATLTD